MCNAIAGALTTPLTRQELDLERLFLVKSPVLQGKYLQDEVVSLPQIGCEPDAERLLAIGAIGELKSGESGPPDGPRIKTFVLPSTIEAFALWLDSVIGTSDLAPSAFRPDVRWHEFPVGDGKVHVSRADPKVYETPFGYFQTALHSAYWGVTTISTKDLQRHEPISFRIVNLDADHIKVQARCGIPALMAYFEELLAKFPVRWPDHDLKVEAIRLPRSEAPRTMDKIKILFLSANPADQAHLAFDEEIRAITDKIRAALHRDDLDLKSLWAVRPDDLLQVLNEHKPHIVHFSGHGTDSGEILLLDRYGISKSVSKETLTSLFRTLKDNIRVVLINACYSRAQAEAISSVIDCTIGMNDEIGDGAAITFAASFYRAIGFRRSVRDAFDQAKTSLMLEGIPEDHIPELLVRPGVDPSQVYLVNP